MQRKNMAANRREILKKCGVAAGTGIGLGSTGLGATGTVQASNGFDFDLEEVWDALIEILKNKLGSTLSVHDVREMQQEAALIAQTTDDSPRIASDRTAAALAEDLSEALEKDITTDGGITPQGSIVSKIIDYVTDALGFTTDLPANLCYKPAWTKHGFCLDTFADLAAFECNGTNVFKLPFKVIEYERNINWNGIYWGFEAKTEAWFGWGQDDCLYAGLGSGPGEVCGPIACADWGQEYTKVYPYYGASRIAPTAFAVAATAIDASRKIDISGAKKWILAFALAFVIVLALTYLAPGVAAGGVVLGGTGLVLGGAWS